MFLSYYSRYGYTYYDMTWWQYPISVSSRRLRQMAVGFLCFANHIPEVKTTHSIHHLSPSTKHQKSKITLNFFFSAEESSLPISLLFVDIDWRSLIIFNSKIILLLAMDTRQQERIIQQPTLRPRRSMQHNTNNADVNVDVIRSLNRRDLLRDRKFIRREIYRIMRNATREVMIQHGLPLTAGTMRVIFSQSFLYEKMIYDSASTMDDYCDLRTLRYRVVWAKRQAKMMAMGRQLVSGHRGGW